MSKLKAATSTGSKTMASSPMAWPELNLPAPDPRIGMTAEHIDALHQWYAAVQVTLNAKLAQLASAAPPASTAKTG